MRTLITLVFVTAAILGLSVAAKASEPSRIAFESCLGQLQSHYGEGTLSPGRPTPQPVRH